MKFMKKFELNDTHPEIEKKLRELYLKLTPEEKFKKMLSLCQTAREIVLSQMPQDISPEERRKKLFIAYYKQDFSEEKFEKILKSLFG